MMHVNYVSFVESIRVLLKARLIKEGSSIVAISSISSIKGLKLKLPYAASKAALNASVMNMASELLPKKIRVNAILKGALTTDVEIDHVRDMVQIGSDNSFSSALGLTTPVEVAETCEFLITDWSGIGIEYAFAFERPVIYIDTPKKIMNNKFNDISVAPLEDKIRDQIGLIVKPEQIENISSIMNCIDVNDQSFRNAIIKCREKFIYNFKNSALEAYKLFAEQN